MKHDPISRGPDAALLQVRDLGIVAEGRTIVSGIGFEVRAGETVGIVGESGSGKSMTARALLGLLPHGVRADGAAVLAGGEDLVRGRRVARLRGRRIAMIFQDPFGTLNPAQRCGQQVIESLRAKGLSRAERRHEALRRLAEVGIDDPTVADRYPFQLSGGMCQRVAIAAALASDPELLIADEPTTALDVTIQAEILRLLKSLQLQRSMGLVLITHDLRVAFSVCDRIYVFYAGRVLEAAPASMLHSDPRHPYTLGLLLAEPELDRRAGALRGIPGKVPAPDDVRDTCAFAARCEWAEEACLSSRPALTGASGHVTACRRQPAIAGAMTERRRVREQEAWTTVDETAEPVLRVNALVKHFTSRHGEVRAVDGVSIELRAGECAALVGESGSGKTTLARCVAGLEAPTAGDVVLPEAFDAGRRGRARQIQMVYQDPRASLHPTRTVGSMLREVVRLAGRVGASQVRDEVARLLDVVGLPAAYGGHSAAALSGGERQRVAIARALALEPRILVCDEVVSALDVSVQAQILNLLNRLRVELGMTYLFVTHDLAVVRQVATQVYVMYRGTVVEHGPVDQVLVDPCHEYTRRLIAAVPGTATASVPS